MSTTAQASENIPRDGFVDREQRKKKRRNRKVRKSSKAGAQGRGGANHQNTTPSYIVSKPASGESVRSSKADRRSSRQTPQRNTNDNDGWTVATKGRKRRNRKGKNNGNNNGNNRKGQNGNNRNTNGANRRNRGSKLVAGKEHMNRRGQISPRRTIIDDEVKEESPSASPSSASTTTTKGNFQGNTRTIAQMVEQDDSYDEVDEEDETTERTDESMATSDTLHSRESTEAPQSVTDTTTSNTTTSSVEVEESNLKSELNPSGLNPEIAEFDPTSLTVTSAGFDGSEEQGNVYSVQMAIQMQLFETLQALELQQRCIQHQIDWVLKPKYSELALSLAQLRSLPHTDHGTYYLLRQQQQGVEQQIAINQKTTVQILERIEYTRESYLRQVERTSMMRNADVPSGEDMDNDHEE